MNWNYLEIFCMRKKRNWTILVGTVLQLSGYQRWVEDGSYPSS